MSVRPKELKQQAERSWVEFFSYCCCCCLSKVSKASPSNSASNTPIITPIDSKRSTPAGTPRLDASQSDVQLLQVAELALISSAQLPIIEEKYENQRGSDQTRVRGELVYHLEDDGEENQVEVADEPLEPLAPGAYIPKR